MSGEPDEPEETFLEEIDYEVFVDDECLATADSRADAMHYAAMYANDGKVTVWKVIKQKERIL